MADRIFNACWSTKNEMDFLDGLLTGKWTGILPMNTKELLKNYIRGVKYRIRYQTWGNVSGDVILEYAISKLEKANAV